MRSEFFPATGTVNYLRHSLEKFLSAESEAGKSFDELWTAGAAVFQKIRFVQGAVSIK